MSRFCHFCRRGTGIVHSLSHWFFLIPNEIQVHNNTWSDICIEALLESLEGGPNVEPRYTSSSQDSNGIERRG